MKCIVTECTMHKARIETLRSINSTQLTKCKPWPRSPVPHIATLIICSFSSTHSGSWVGRLFVGIMV